MSTTVEGPPPRSRGPRASERDCQQTIVDAARLLGYRVLAIRPSADQRGRWKSPIQGDPGYPDLTLVHPRAGVMFVELKRAPNRLEADQVAWRDAMRAANACWLLVWVPELLDEFCQLLADLAHHTEAI